MKISEVIDRLESIMKMYGDMPAFIANDEDCNDYTCLEVCKIDSCHFASWNDDKKSLDSIDNSVTIIYGEK